MLIQFKFSNYKSFCDEATLDLSATEVNEHPHHMVKISNDEKVLKTAAIFGANACGKTNLYHALRYMVSYVCNSFGFGGKKDSINMARNPDPFLFDAISRTKNSEFRMLFTIPNDEKIYNYGFCVNKEAVTEEWLYSKAPTEDSEDWTTLFERSNDEKLDLSGIQVREEFKTNIQISLQKETLILSLGAKLKVKLLSKIYNWFDNIIFLDFGNPPENFFLSHVMPNDFQNEPQVRKDVIDYLNSFDPGITNFEIKKVGDKADKFEKYEIRTLHHVSETDEDISIPLRHEAAGTQKMFNLYSPLKDTLDSGGVIFIDEFNDRLHPLLGRSIIQIFLDPERNPNNAQLIITTHDTCILAQNLLRRDEIWIIEKKDEKSQLYSLVDFKEVVDPKITKDKNYEIDYLEGKYGGIPYLEGIHLKVK